MKKKTKITIILIGILLLALIIGLVIFIKKKNETIEEDTVIFTDFLVERCIRKELSKGWDEPISYEELESITSLVISNSYDPTFSVYSNLGKNAIGYSGYIDLSDLKYLTNLEELKIDAYDGADMIVNVESIANCTKLKELAIPCGHQEYSYESMNLIGYKHWIDIFAKLPELEKVDFGMYVDEHMKEVILSKSDAKNVEFYEGKKISTDYGERSTYLYYQSAVKSGRGLIFTIEEDADYNDAWDHSYKGSDYIYEAYTSMHFNAGTEGIFPAIVAGDQSDLVDKLDKLDSDTEDIIVILNGGDEFDFSVFDRFENLVTLTVYNKDFRFETESIYNPETMQQEINSKEYIGMQPINVDKLSSHKNLQVLNLSGFIGDLSGVSSIKKLRELGIINCIVDNTDFIGNLKNVKELTLSLTADVNDDIDDLTKELDSQVCKLSGLKYYYDQNFGYSCEYENISNMSGLESLLIVGGSEELYLENVVKSDSIENLYIDSNCLNENINKIHFNDMDKLKNLVINSISTNFIKSIDIEKLAEIPTLVSVSLPCMVSCEDVLTPELAEKIVSSDNISAFVFHYEKSLINMYIDDADIEYIKTLYNAGIEDGIFRAWAHSKWTVGDDVSIDDFVEYKK